MLESVCGVWGGGGGGSGGRRDAVSFPSGCARRLGGPWPHRASERALRRTTGRWDFGAVHTPTTRAGGEKEGPDYPSTAKSVYGLAPTVQTICIDFPLSTALPAACPLSAIHPPRCPPPPLSTPARYSLTPHEGRGFCSPYVHTLHSRACCSRPMLSSDELVTEGVSGSLGIPDGEPPHACGCFLACLAAFAEERPLSGPVGQMGPSPPSLRTDRSSAVVMKPPARTRGRRLLLLLLLCEPEMSRQSTTTTPTTQPPLNNAQKIESVECFPR